MINLLTSLSEHALLIELGCFIVALALFKSRTNAFVVTLGAFTALGIIHVIYEYWLLEEAGRVYSVDQVRTLWYLGFGISDFFLVGFISYLLGKKFIERDWASELILVSFTVHGFNQVARYVDRVILQTDVLGYIYSLTVTTLNTTVLCVVLCGVLRGVWNRAELELEQGSAQ